MIKYENGDFLLENGCFSRRLRLDADGLRSVSFRCEGREYAVIDTPPEFSFSLNGVSYSGYAPGSQKLTYKNHEILTGEHGAELLNISFELPDSAGVVTVVSVIYPDLPGCVRRIRFEAGKEEMDLSQLILETFNLAPREPVDLQIFREQGRVPALAQFTVTGSDDMVRFHDGKAQCGYYTGSSIPGPLRYVMCYPHWATGIRYGYSCSTPLFRKYILPGECWESDEIYLCLYKGNTQDCTGRNDFRELIRRSMPELTSVAGPMYCTWIPFLKNISENLVSDIATLAQEVGFDILVLDDGWFVDGKWQVDAEKFPRGLEAVAEDCRSKGLKFGLWFNIGTDYGDVGSNVDTNGLMPDLTTKKSGHTSIRCFASEHRELITEKLKSLAKQYGLAYFKMDFSNIISPYGVQAVGCASCAHKYHRNADDAVVEQYRSLYALRENLKKDFPELCLDYSFEVFGTEFPGVAGLQFSDIQHVSNLHTSERFYDLRMVREAIYAFTAMLPPERVSGTLIELKGGEAVEALYSSMAGNPLMAGDLRTLSAEERKAAKNIFTTFKNISAAGALTEMQTWKWQHDAGNPAESPDGYFRWSRKTGEGIAAFFANDSGVDSVTVKLPIADSLPRTLIDPATLESVGVYEASQLKEGVKLPLNGQKVRGFAVKKG